MDPLLFVVARNNLQNQKNGRILEEIANQNRPKRIYTDEDIKRLTQERLEQEEWNRIKRYLLILWALFCVGMVIYLTR